MSSGPSSPWRDTAPELENQGNDADAEDPLNCVTTFSYKVIRGVMTIVNSNDPATNDLHPSQGGKRRRGRKRAGSIEEI
jgi:hypothetical protein